MYALVFLSNLLDSFISVSSYLDTIIFLLLFCYIRMDPRVLMIVAAFRKPCSVFLDFFKAQIC